jgi:hypothetical protein
MTNNNSDVTNRQLRVPSDRELSVDELDFVSGGTENSAPIFLQLTKSFEPPDPC